MEASSISFDARVKRDPQVTKKIGDIYMRARLFVCVTEKLKATGVCRSWLLNVTSSNSCKVIILIFVVTSFRWRWSSSLKKQRNILVKDNSFF